MWVRIALLSCIALGVAPAAGPLIDYVTYLGGTYTDAAAGIAVDSTGAAYVAGTTSSPDFPLTSTSLGTPTTNSYCAFVTKLNPSGTAIDFSVCLAASRTDAFALDATGNMYLALERFPSPLFVSAAVGDDLHCFPVPRSKCSLDIQYPPTIRNQVEFLVGFSF
ncbi:MAG TPA: SBBP repeat-containing protein [Bryobacteraceae bacterium]|nr:SBBP repeat-containing protein [Bryobacteraceae bacterium]